MKNALLYLSAVLLFASCAPLNLHYKEGQQVSRMSSDLAKCEATAQHLVPKDIRTRYIPPTYLPYGYCQPFGPCFSHYHLSSYGHTKSYDANEGRRKDVAAQCMADQGYTQVKIPACSAEVVRATRIGSTKTLPALTESSCSIRLKSGGWQIVNPG